MSDVKEFHVGELADTMPELTQYTPSPFKKGRPPEPLQFEINVTAEAHDRQKKSGMVQVNIPGFSPVKLYCDEQTPVGDDTAPPPLAFLSAGIAFCLMTHLTDIYTARKIKIKSMKIEQRMKFQTNLSNMRDLGHTTEGETMGIETHVLIDSDEPQERIMELMDEAENACMAHHALRNPISWESRLVYNGQEVLKREG
ncbi:OsmC family protein [uncultured Sulfitobacter sp.]|uniref:OsmC family protein n=1 Tax=uncultured Sulfitobacter sp. TaxID=191468 RepID=UPI00263A15CC|nr:OsmC family protein [uncultured Sulfitobacter sp.]